MNGSRQALRFLWWNLQSFAHFEKTRAGETQWPPVQEAFDAKAARVESVLRQLYGDDPPEVLGFAEITNKAALDLCRRLFPHYLVLSMDLLAKPELQVAFVYNASTGHFEEQPPIAVPGTPRGTRPMAVLDYCSDGHRIRLIACHWTARFGKSSKHVRSDVAHFLMSYIYDFLHEIVQGETRHIVILGDLNEEPYKLLEERLHACRSRSRSREREHYRAADVKRVRLYNCAWRFIGERYPHMGGPSANDTAGTYYWEAEKTWHTFDHVIVNGSLLTDAIPFLDESSVRVLTCPLLLEPEGKPEKFDWRNGKPTGVSDHLPIAGQIILAREKSHD
jgi:hypothetical protein